MTSIFGYEQPILFGVYTDLLLNPATQGGELIDTNPDDNQTVGSTLSENTAQSKAQINTPGSRVAKRCARGLHGL